MGQRMTTDTAVKETKICSASWALIIQVISKVNTEVLCQSLKLFLDHEIFI